MNTTELKIIQYKKQYIVKRVGFPRRFHSHFKTRSGAVTLINLLTKDELPKNKYFIKAAKRVTTDNEFENLRPPKRKQKYCNRTKCVI